MKILQLKRKYLLHKQIYALNYLLRDFYHFSWDSALDYSICENKLITTDDIWLKILSLPLKQFYFLIDLTIITLLFTDKSLKIRGKHLVYLINKYGVKFVELANKNATLFVENINIEINEIIQSDSFYEQSRKYLVERVYFNKSIALKSRLLYKFDKKLIVEREVVNFWQPITINSIEKIALQIAKSRFSHYFR